MSRSNVQCCLWPDMAFTETAHSTGHVFWISNQACSLHLHCFDNFSPQPLLAHSLTHLQLNNLLHCNTRTNATFLVPILYYWTLYYIIGPFTTFLAFIYTLQVSLFHKCSQSYCTPECSSPLLLITPALLLQLTAATVTALLTAAVHYSSSSLGPCSPVTSAQAPGTPRSTSPQSYITPHPGILHIALKFGWNSCALQAAIMLTVTLKV